MSTQEKIRWREKGNPYEVVREETTEEVCYGDRRVTTIGFDAKDRSEVYKEVFSKVQAEFPDYTLQIAMDTDFSE